MMIFEKIEEPSRPFLTGISAEQVDSSGEAAVDKDYFWQPMATCPQGVKVQLLGAGGVAVYSTYVGKDLFWQGWAPLPTKNLKVT